MVTTGKYRGSRTARFVLHATESIHDKIEAAFEINDSDDHEYSSYVKITDSPANLKGINACEIVSSASMFEFLTNHIIGFINDEWRRKRIALVIQMCDTLYQQYHEKHREAQAACGWERMSRIDSWPVMLTQYINVLHNAQAWAKSKGKGRSCPVQLMIYSERSKGSGKECEHDVRRLERNLGLRIYRASNLRACEDLCASIPAMFNPRLVRCVAQYESESKIAPASDPESDSDVLLDLFADWNETLDAIDRDNIDDGE